MDGVEDSLVLVVLLLLLLHRNYGGFLLHQEKMTRKKATRRDARQGREGSDESTGVTVCLNDYECCTELFMGAIHGRRERRRKERLLVYDDETTTTRTIFGCEEEKGTSWMRRILTLSLLFIL